MNTEEFIDHSWKKILEWNILKKNLISRGISANEIESKYNYYRFTSRKDNIKPENLMDYVISKIKEEFKIL